MIFAYIWEYRIAAEHVETFKADYGRGGQWVGLYRRDPAYIRTELLSDSSDPQKFITFDYWDTWQTCLAFCERFRSECDAIDAKCAHYALEERHLGDVDLLG